MNAVAGPAVRWTNRLAMLAIVGVLVCLLVGAVVGFAGGVAPHLVVGGFFLCISLLKFAIATDGVLRLRCPRVGEPDPRETQGSTGMAVAWVVYKYAACAIALGAAIFVLTAGAARTDSLFGG